GPTGGAPAAPCARRARRSRLPTGRGRARRWPLHTRARGSPAVPLERPDQLLVAGLARVVRRLVLLGVLGQDEAGPEVAVGAPGALDDGAGDELRLSHRCRGGAPGGWPATGSFSSRSRRTRCRQ